MKTNRYLIVLLLVAALLLSSCSTSARVGALRTESKSVELGDAKSVRVEIGFGAGDLQLTGGADKLMEADFTYNVAKIKPEVTYTDGTLVVQQPETNGFPSLLGITEFRNDWGVQLSDEVPMDLSVDQGAGTGTLLFSGLSLTGLDVVLTKPLSGRGRDSSCATAAPPARPTATSAASAGFMFIAHLRRRQR